MNIPNPEWMHAYSQESKYATIMNCRSVLLKSKNAPDPEWMHATIRIGRSLYEAVTINRQLIGRLLICRTFFIANWLNRITVNRIICHRKLIDR